MAINKNAFVKSNWEYIFPVLAVLSLVASCVLVSNKKFFWNDEILSFYLLDDHSFSHMLLAWSDKFNQAPPLFFMLGWLWDKIFGSTELSLRLFSSFSFGVACFVVWTVLRRTYDFWSTTIGTLSVFCLSKLVLYQNAEARMYGLFTLVCACGLLQFDLLNREHQPSRKSLVVNGLTHGAIVLTHLYGALYSGAILGAFIVRDWYFGMFRRNVYLSVLFSWSVLLALSPLLINQSNNSAKWFFAYGLPATLDLVIPFPKFWWFIFLLLFFSIVISRLKISTIKAHHLNERRGNSEPALLIFAVFIMAIPFLAWVISATIKPILGERYIIPTITLSWPIFLTFLIARIIPNTNDKSFSFGLRTITLAAVTLAVLIEPVYYGTGWVDSQKPGATDGKYGYPDLPIALEAGHDFLARFYYSTKPSRYFHILDWETASNNVKSAFATGDYVHLDAISRNYPFIQSVQSTDFLKKYDRFIVLNEGDQNEGRGRWFEARIKDNPDYQVKQLGTEAGAWGPLEVILVERKNHMSTVPFPSFVSIDEVRKDTSVEKSAGYIEKIALAGENLVVDGWAADTAAGAPAVAIHVFVAGRDAAVGIPNLSRSNVATTLNIASSNVFGFHIIAPQASLPIYPIFRCLMSNCNSAFGGYVNVFAQMRDGSFIELENVQAH